jgi:hypothetical protein
MAPDAQPVNNNPVVNRRKRKDLTSAQRQFVIDQSLWNQDAINAGIFHHHLKQTHSQNPGECPPAHTIIIKGANLTWRFSSIKRKKQQLRLNQRMQQRYMLNVAHMTCKVQANTALVMLIHS